MKDADFTHYQFMATLDRRTCARCGERDGEIFALADMEQGENAPPMHPRCRCTICATFDTPKGKSRTSGERAAREVNRERVPADMTYKDWKAVYINKSIPAIKINDYEDVAIVRMEKDFLKFANEVKAEIEQYSGGESKWSGKILLAGENDRSGGKVWSCDIRECW